MRNNAASSRWAKKGERPARIANCSGARGWFPFYFFFNLTPVFSKFKLIKYV